MRDAAVPVELHGVETVVALFISSQWTMTLPTAIWNGIRDNIDPTIVAIGTIAILPTLPAAATIRLRWRSHG